MDLNNIPWNTVHEPDHRTFHANRLSSWVLGRRIDDVKISITTQCPEWTRADDDQASYIDHLAFIFEDPARFATTRKLVFHESEDMGYVGLWEEHVCQLTAAESAQVVEGFATEEGLREMLARRPRLEGREDIWECCS